MGIYTILHNEKLAYTVCFFFNHHGSVSQRMSCGLVGNFVWAMWEDLC